jgi:HTH-type transcriptional regulator/antitoxin HigA
METLQYAPTTKPEALSNVLVGFDAFRNAAGFGAIRTKTEYRRALALAESIFDSTRNTPEREDASHPLMLLLDLIAPAIEAYENKHYPMPGASPRDVVRLLMQQNGLAQKDLPEIGNQSVVSQFLAGKRGLNTRQIAALAARFHLLADAFIERPVAIAA